MNQAPIWEPSADRIDGANISRFMRFVRESTGNEDIRRYAPLIKMQAIDSEVMPLGNETGMTREERDTLGAWIAANGG